MKSDHQNKKELSNSEFGISQVIVNLLSGLNGWLTSSAANSNSTYPFMYVVPTLFFESGIFWLQFKVLWKKWKYKPTDKRKSLITQVLLSGLILVTYIVSAIIRDFTYPVQNLPSAVLYNVHTNSTEKKQQLTLKTL